MGFYLMHRAGNRKKRKNITEYVQNLINICTKSLVNFWEWGPSSTKRTQEPWAQMNRSQQEKGTTEQSRRNGKTAPCKLCALKEQLHKGQKGTSQARTWEHSSPEVKSCRKCCQTTFRPTVHQPTVIWEVFKTMNASCSDHPVNSQR